MLFSGGLDGVAVLLKQIKDGPHSRYTLLFVENGVDGEDRKHARGIYQEIKRLYPGKIDAFVFEQVMFEPRGYKPKVNLWINLYASALRLAIECGADTVLSGALAGDGQDEIAFHKRFVKFAKIHYGIDIVAPYISKRYLKDPRANVLKDLARIVKSDKLHDFSKVLDLLDISASDLVII